MENNIKEEMKKRYPVEVALTLPLTWDEGDILSEEMVRERLNLLIDSLPDAQKDNARRILSRNPQYYARKAIAQDKAWDYAASEGWLDETSYRSGARFIVLRKIEEAYGYEAALALGKQFNLGYVSRPEAMWDCLAEERVSPEFVLAMYGDDRSYYEGEYFLCLSYCNQRIDELWFPTVPYCGAF